MVVACLSDSGVRLRRSHDLKRTTLFRNAQVQTIRESRNGVRSKHRFAAKATEDGAVISLPTRMNSVPHPKEMRRFFYEDVVQAVKAAVADGKSRMSVRMLIPETNPEMDVYRIGTLLEMVREIVFSLAQDGSNVKVCVQQSLGEGVFTGMPLSLVGVRRIMEAMDWGGYDDFLKFGEVRATEVDDICAFYILIAPQNIVGSTIMPDLGEMITQAEEKGSKMLLINPLLDDVPSAAGVMGVKGRKERMALYDSFIAVYHFRLLYTLGTLFPIRGALRYSYGQEWQVYKRMQYGKKIEGYELCEGFKTQPKGDLITKAIRQKTKSNKTT